jgi:hypothetical protein
MGSSVFIYRFLFLNFLLYSVSWNMSGIGGEVYFFHKQIKINGSYRCKNSFIYLMKPKRDGER